MNTTVTTQSDRGAAQEPGFPAYGPVEAVLGYAMFYVVIDRVTPAVVETFSVTVLDLSPSFVRFGLAAALWFVLAVTALDQVRRQLVALGVLGDGDDDPGLRLWSRVTPGSLRISGYAATFVVGTAVAAVTFERAIAALLALIPAVATADAVAVNLGGGLVLAVFFVAYGVATHSLDRLVVGTVRALVSE
jgi:hypothetical protein